MSARRRIAFCIDTLDSTGGTELNAVRTIEHIGRDWCEPTVVALSSFGTMGARYEAADVRVIAVARHPARMSTLARVMHLARLFREHRFDAVHSHDMFTSALCSAAGRLARVPRIVSSKRWIRVDDRRWRIMSRGGYSISDVVVANSEAVKRTLIEDDGVPAAKVRVVPNFVEDEAFAALTADEIRRWKADVGLVNAGTVIGCVAQLRVEKGHLELLEAFAGVLSEGEQATLALAGEGVFADTIRERARTLGIQDRVILLGRMPRLPSPHQLFDVSVLASHHEGMPNSLVEAMAIGRPVVATNVGGVPELVVDGSTGLLVPPRHPEALRLALLALIRDAALRRRLGAAGAHFVRKRHSTHAAMERIRQVHMGESCR